MYVQEVQKRKFLASMVEKEIQKLQHSLPSSEKDTTLLDIDKNVLNVKQAITDKEKGIDELKNDRESHDLETQIKGYEQQLSAMAGRDKECVSTTCQFLLSAKKAEESLKNAQIMLENRKTLVQESINDLISVIEGLHDQLHILTKNRRDRSAELEYEINLINKRIASSTSDLKTGKEQLAACQTIQTENRQTLATARMELNMYQTLAAKLPEIAVAKSKKEDRVKALEENTKQGKEISAAWEAKKETLEGQINEQKGKFDVISSQINVQVFFRLGEVDGNITKITSSITEADKAISETSSLISTYQGQLQGISEAEEQLKKAQEEKSKVSGDISDWTYLRNACGKNGLQAMEIDGAAPIITGFANDLLSQAFGSLYTVKFQTQDENGKECLDIITIGEDGEEVLLDNLSGGQKTWILMALRLAMTLLSKEKGGRNFETAFFDELDGPLDADNAVNFINLYKSFMKIGHFSTIPFISHKPECRSMADHVLMFEAGKNPYWQ